MYVGIQKSTDYKKDMFSTNVEYLCEFLIWILKKNTKFAPWKLGILGGHGIGINIHDCQPNLEMAIYALKTRVNPNNYTGSVWSQSPIPKDGRNDRYHNAPYSQYNSIILGWYEMWRKLQMGDTKENLNRSKRFMRNMAIPVVGFQGGYKIRKVFG